MEAFAVVIALLAVAAAGWLLSRAARSVLRRHGVPTDESDVAVGRPRPDGDDAAGEPPIHPD